MGWSPCQKGGGGVRRPRPTISSDRSFCRAAAAIDDEAEAGGQENRAVSGGLRDGGDHAPSAVVRKPGGGLTVALELDAAELGGYVRRGVFDEQEGGELDPVFDQERTAAGDEEVVEVKIGGRADVAATEVPSTKPAASKPPRWRRTRERLAVRLNTRGLVMPKVFQSAQAVK